MRLQRGLRQGVDAEAAAAATQQAGISLYICIYIYIYIYISVSLCVSWLADFPGEKSHGQRAMSSTATSTLRSWQIERVTKVKCSEK